MRCLLPSITFLIPYRIVQEAGEAQLPTSIKLDEKQRLVQEEAGSHPNQPTPSLESHRRGECRTDDHWAAWNRKRSWLSLHPLHGLLGCVLYSLLTLSGITFTYLKVMIMPKGPMMSCSSICGWNIGIQLPTSVKKKPTGSLNSLNPTHSTFSAAQSQGSEFLLFVQKWVLYRLLLSVCERFFCSYPSKKTGAAFLIQFCAGCYIFGFSYDCGVFLLQYVEYFLSVLKQGLVVFNEANCEKHFKNIFRQDLFTSSNQHDLSWALRVFKPLYRRHIKEKAEHCQTAIQTA